MDTMNTTKPEEQKAKATIKAINRRCRRGIQIISQGRAKRGEQWAIKWSDASRGLTPFESKAKALRAARYAASDNAAPGNVVVMIAKQIM